MSLCGQPDQRPPPVGRIVLPFEQCLAFQVRDDPLITDCARVMCAAASPTVSGPQRQCSSTALDAPGG